MDKTMSITDHLSDVLSTVNDQRCRNNIELLTNKIIESNHLKIYKLSNNTNEYERFHNLLNGDSKNGLNWEILNDNLIEKAEERHQGKPSLTVIHDCSDLRKPYSQDLEKITKVKSLDGRLVSGFRSFDSIAVDLDNKELSLLSCIPGGKGVNLNDLGIRNIVKIHEKLKSSSPDMVITHILDRWFDDVKYFEELDALEDSSFIIRAKVNRNSDVSYLSDKNRERKVKWANKDLMFSFKKSYSKFGWGKKVHHNAQATFSYEPVFIEEKKYYLLKVDFRTKKGTRIFKNPMLLISNYIINSEEMALWVFSMYLKRSKIEGVFKFLKEYLGWETFGVQDWQSIQNIIVLCYFIGGYFYEMEQELIENYDIIQICKLGNGKGKVTKVFFLRGLQKLAHYQEMNDFFEKNNFSQQQIEDFINQFK